MIAYMDKLRAWLDLIDKSPEWLSHEIGVTPNTVRNWLAGRNHPGGLQLRRLHERTGIDLEELVPPLEKGDAA